MADPIVLEFEIVKDARSKPQYSQFDPLTCEINQIIHPQRKQSRIDPKLLRVIVNGDLTSFNKILGIQEAPNDGDVESVQVAGRGISGLCGVTCGGNTPLHVVAGVIEKFSPIETFSVNLNINLYPYTVLGLAGASAAVMFISMQSFAISLFHSVFFVFPVKRICKSIAAEKVKVHILLEIEKTTIVKFFMTKLTNLWKSKTMKWKRQNVQLIEKAERTRWLNWVLSLPYIRILCKRRRYLVIAGIIYHEDNTLLSATNYAMETPLHCAVKAGKLEMVSLLVDFARMEGKKKVEEVLRARNHVGETALHEAARSGYSDIVKELMDADKVVLNTGEGVLNADENLANLVDHSGASPLYLAVASGCLDVVRKLISSNGPTSYAGPNEQTALHAAVLKQDERIMWVIHEWKQSLATTTDKAKNTPLHYAALIGNRYAIRVLLSKDTQAVYEKNLSGSFPVHIAAEAGNFTVIKELLSSCPDVGELLDKENRNFLHVAVEKKRTGVVMLACQQGINANVLNAKDKDGNTPLHLAVISSDADIFALLSLNKIVNPNIINKDGLTPLDISTSLQDREFTYSLSPQSIIHRALLTRDAFQNPCQPDLSNRDNGARADCPNQREGKEECSAVGIDTEKESTKYENMSRTLITGAVLISSAAFVAIFTVSGVYKSDNTSNTLISKRTVFKAFIIADVLAFICATVSTSWLLYSALTKFHLKYRKFYFRCCTPLLYGAINLFILTFGLGGYVAIAPLSEWLGLLIFVISGSSVLWNIIWNPKFVPLILLAPYVTTDLP